MAEKKFDVEDRFVEFASRIVDVVEALPKTRAGIRNKARNSFFIS